MKKFVILLVFFVSINTLFITVTHAESNNAPPELISEAVIMIDSQTGTVLFEKNIDRKMYPASLTKIATAIYAIETGNLDDVVKVSENARNIEGTRVYLEEGEQVTLRKLLQGLLINSGNDAGVAIAEHLSGSIEDFSSDINKYLKDVVGVQNTHFENPHGLYDPEHFTTAEDLAKITQYAIKNETFRGIFGTKELKWNGKSWDTTLYKHHKLMREIPYEGITGGKTGFVNQSGFTLATTAKRDNLSLIVITLNSYNQSAAYTDTISLLDYGFNNFETSRIREGTIFTVSNQKYRTTSDIIYTHALNEQLRKKVNDGGMLEIITQDGSVLSSYPLNKIEKARTPGKEQKTNEISTASRDTNSIFVIGGHFLEFVFAMILCLVIVGGSTYHIREIVRK
ncbi:D-alanyl-D-alanine carboxypeptidase family protein [Oceanobacillus bengalensis]|uniref:D-alanyl-D-alanine carboxypeptidase n=1 Tax=Oceanobacillus bengalensis TaxID=1435466 RepID=A0A494Z8E0_9BACI|nr:D-alanyl-D-alanine carboxypeptidase family protein [Oceanobacillus bengalensis]RKQ18287.1 D-alanyl-D-alanine carboxypeptidase [Oceanobacillus bengalensis]